MWPFRTDHDRSHRANAATYAALFDLWARAEHRQSVSTFQLGFLHGSGVRRRPPLPLLQLLPEPGASIDFADRLTGFPGLDRPPASDRVLTVWADDLVSVHHGEHWIFVADSDRPLAPPWLELLRRGANRQRPSYAVVTAAFGTPAPVGPFRLADIDATTHSTLVHVDDRRRAVGLKPPRPHAVRR